MADMHDPASTGNFTLPQPKHFRWDEIPNEHFPMREIRTSRRESSPSISSPPNVMGPSGVKTSELFDDQQAGSKGGWIRTPAPPTVDQGVKEVWHYTDAAGVIGAVSSGCIWATSISMLNDSAEYQHGRDILNRVLHLVDDSQHVHPLQKQFISDVITLSDGLVKKSDLFIACTSLAHNSLAQWRAYGGNAGHALIIDPHEELSIVSPIMPSTHISIRPRWRKVLYDVNEQAEFLRECLGFVANFAPVESEEFIDNDKTRDLALVLIEAVAYCKDPSFSEEQELRMVVQSPGPEAVNFRSSRLGVTPFLKLTAAAHFDERTTAESRQLPVVGVAVGPFDGRDVSGRGVAALLRRYEYFATPVYVSTSTLR